MVSAGYLAESSHAHPLIYLLISAAIAWAKYQSDKDEKSRAEKLGAVSTPIAEASSGNGNTRTMKHYNVYENQIGLKEAVKQGWSWPAFFFTAIWAFIKKLNAIGGGVIIGWLVAGAIIGNMVTDGSEDGADTANGIVMLLGIAVSVVFGVNGNGWREKNLTGRGYALTGTVTAASDEGAVAMHCQQRGSPATKSPTSSSRES